MNREQAHNLIKNANSCGQGYYENYSDNPFHQVIILNGFEYSHSTPVCYYGVYIIHHTYKHKSNRVIGIHYLDKWRWNSSINTSSCRNTIGYTPEKLQKHLKNVLRKFYALYI